MSKTILVTITLFGSLYVFADDSGVKTCVTEHLAKAKSLAGETITVAGWLSRFDRPPATNH